MMWWFAVAAVMWLLACWVLQRPIRGAHRQVLADRAVEIVAEHHAEFVKGTLLAFEQIEHADDPRVEARRHREFMEYALRKVWQ